MTYCKQCDESIVITSQNKDAKFCNDECYNAWRLINRPNTYKESPHAIPTGIFPKFV